MTDNARAGAVLYAKDVEKVAAFYAAVLGLGAAGKDDEHVLLESRVFQLVVRRIPDGLAATIHIAVPPVRRSTAVVKLVFFVPSIAEVRAAVAAHGGLMDSAPKEWLLHGWRAWDGLDPEGNVIQFRFRMPAG